MKEIIAILCILTACSSGYSETQKVKTGFCTFYAPISYHISENSGLRICLTDTVALDSCSAVKTLSVQAADIDAEANNIENITDMADLEYESVTQDFFVRKVKLEGMKTVNGQQFYFYITELSTASNRYFSSILSYEYRVEYFFIHHAAVYVVELSARVQLPKDSDSEFVAVSQQIYKKIDLADIDIVLQSLKML